MIVTATFFGKTKRVTASPWNMKENETPDEILWVERGEDMYVLSSSAYENKKIAIVNRHEWLRAKEIKND